MDCCPFSQSGSPGEDSDGSAEQTMDAGKTRRKKMLAWQVRIIGGTSTGK
jgi:hypothetical protein